MDISELNVGCATRKEIENFIFQEEESQIIPRLSSSGFPHHIAVAAALINKGLYPIDFLSKRIDEWAENNPGRFRYDSAHFPRLHKYAFDAMGIGLTQIGILRWLHNPEVFQGKSPIDKLSTLKMQDVTDVVDVTFNIRPETPDISLPYFPEKFELDYLLRLSQYEQLK